MKNLGIWAGLGRDFADFPDFSRNDPKWSPRALGLLFGGLGGPWNYYLGVWGPKIILKIVSFYRIVAKVAIGFHPEKVFCIP